MNSGELSEWRVSQVNWHFEELSGLSMVVPKSPAQCSWFAEITCAKSLSSTTPSSACADKRTRIKALLLLLS